MPDPDHDAESERRTNPLHDRWPIQRTDAHTQWPVERTTPGEDDRTLDDGVEHVGALGPMAGADTVYLFDPNESALIEGRVDEDEQRIVVEEDHEHHEVDSPDSLGEHLEAIGEEHGWTWLSSFAHEHLEDEEAARATGLAYEHSKFDRKNLVEASDPDLAFVGSHTFADADDEPVVVEREYDVFLEPGSDRTRIEVREDVRSSEGEKRERQAGDAGLEDRREFELALDVAADDPAREEKIGEALEEWHRANPGPQLPATREGQSPEA